MKKLLMSIVAAFAFTTLAGAAYAQDKPAGEQPAAGTEAPAKKSGKKHKKAAKKEGEGEGAKTEGKGEAAPTK
ncbi:MAG TPA: hypothetical protein VH877_23725 [Polyangia bacterium]|nr:hypothetical protein [Polyangia bacterium]